MTPILPSTISQPNGTYVHGLTVPSGAQLLFVSGQIPVHRDGTIPKNFKDQAALVFYNIAEILREAGSGIEHIVKITSFLTDVTSIPEFAAVRAGFLQDHRPTSTLLVVSALAKPELLVEVEAIAMIPEGSRR